MKSKKCYHIQTREQYWCICDDTECFIYPNYIGPNYIITLQEFNNQFTLYYNDTISLFDDII
jgi:hypothetical protein